MRFSHHFTVGTRRVLSVAAMLAVAFCSIAPSHGDDREDALVNESPQAWVDAIKTQTGDPRAEAEAALARWVQAKLKVAKRASEQKDAAQTKLHFEQIVAPLSEVVRESLAAPWVYEGLALAMQGADYPPSEIRRVLLSSIDFGADTQAAIKIARYLETQGMKTEALAIYRDAHRANPSERLPLEAGLQLSLELEDRDAAQWSTVGILGQAWRDDELDIIEKAALLAKATYIRLTNEGRKMEAFAFEQSLKQAQMRDIVVRVSWTGNADIDIAVEEPTGTICDAAHPRTIAGGLLLGDTSSLDRAGRDGYSETYACAKGYSGTYRIAIRKIWGEVAGGKVTVQLVTDYKTPDQRYIEQQISLERDALLMAEVKNGHRKEPIAEAQLAKLQWDKQLASEAVLAQVGNNGELSESPSLSQQWAYQRMLSNYASRNSNAVVPPFFRRGAVGYRPNITVIPSGTSLVAMAVISGDRRYVRVDAAPFFSDIVAVDTFNFIDGSGTNNGAGGGLGGGGLGGGGLGGGGGGLGGGFRNNGGGFGGGGAF